MKCSTQKIQRCSITSSCILQFASQHAFLAILTHNHLRSGRHIYSTVCCVNINYTERAQIFDSSLAEWQKWQWQMKASTSELMCSLFYPQFALKKIDSHYQKKYIICVLESDNCSAHSMKICRYNVCIILFLLVLLILQYIYCQTLKNLFSSNIRTGRFTLKSLSRIHDHKPLAVLFIVGPISCLWSMHLTMDETLAKHSK